MVFNRWKASRGCSDLNSYCEGKINSAIVYEEMIADGTIKGQCKELIKLYSLHDEGLTDVQASSILGWDASTVSARRNDITRKKGNHVIVTNGKRDNGLKRRSGCVWNINKNSTEW